RGVEELLEQLDELDRARRTAAARACRSERRVLGEIRRRATFASEQAVEHVLAGSAAKQWIDRLTRDELPLDAVVSQLAAAASYTKDYATAREAFAGLNDAQVDHEPFDEVKLNASEARCLASVMAGPAAKKLVELDWSRLESEYLQKDDLDVYETELRAIRQLDASPASQIYWEGLERPIAWRKAYLKGDWVDLTFAEGMPGWSVCGARREVENATSVVITSRLHSPPMQLRCRFPVEPPYVVEVDIENMPPSDPFNRLGVVIGDPAALADNGKYLWIDPSRQLVGRSRFDGEQEGDKFEFQDRTRVRIHVWENEYERFLNDVRVDGERVDGLADQGQLSFGTVFVPLEPYSVRFSNIRVRRLMLDPPSADGTASEGL
ncbi:MAG: hypothetical protein ACC628_18610, partial [Pirellulaceae bacterium]